MEKERKKRLKLNERDIRSNRGLSKLLNIVKEDKDSLVRNRCIVTGRSRSVYRRFKISRLELKRQVKFGMFLCDVFRVKGLKKASW